MYRERHKRCPFLSVGILDWYRVVAALSPKLGDSAQLLDTNLRPLPNSKRDIFCGAPCIYPPSGYQLNATIGHKVIFVFGIILFNVTWQ